MPGRLWRVVALAVLSCGAPCAAAPEPPARRVKFHQPDQIPPEIKIENLAAARRAVVKFSGFMGRCTGVYISNDGYLLTAMHCFRRDLLWSGVAQPQAVDRAGHKRYVLNAEKLRKLTLNIVLDGKEVQASVAAAGPGFMSDALSGVIHEDLRLGNDLRSQGFDFMGDFMILKIHSQETTPCLDAASEDAVPGEVLWSLSYPAKSERGDGFDSNGIDQFFSYGTITGIRRNACLDESYYSGGDDDFRRLSDWFFNNPGTAWTDLDILPGSSGAPVLDSLGRIVGMVTRIDAGKKADVKAYCGATNFTRISAIRKIIDETGRSRPGRIPSSRLFSCVQTQSKAVPPPRLPLVPQSFPPASWD